MVADGKLKKEGVRRGWQVWWWFAAATGIATPFLSLIACKNISIRVATKETEKTALARSGVEYLSEIVDEHGSIEGAVEWMSKRVFFLQEIGWLADTFPLVRCAKVIDRFSWAKSPLTVYVVHDPLKSDYVWIVVSSWVHPGTREAHQIATVWKYFPETQSLSSQRSISMPNGYALGSAMCARSGVLRGVMFRSDTVYDPSFYLITLSGEYLHMDSLPFPSEINRYTTELISCSMVDSSLQFLAYLPGNTYSGGKLVFLALSYRDSNTFRSIRMALDFPPILKLSSRGTTAGLYRENALVTFCPSAEGQPLVVIAHPLLPLVVLWYPYSGHSDTLYVPPFANQSWMHRRSQAILGLLAETPLRFAQCGKGFVHDSVWEATAYAPYKASAVWCGNGRIILMGTFIPDTGLAWQRTGTPIPVELLFLALYNMQNGRWTVSADYDMLRLLYSGHPFVPHSMFTFIYSFTGQPFHMCAPRENTLLCAAIFPEDYISCSRQKGYSSPVRFFLKFGASIAVYTALPRRIRESQLFVLEHALGEEKL